MKNILIPTDLTDCTLSTLKYAILLGEKSNSKLLFYHLTKDKRSDFPDYFMNFIKTIFTELKLDFNRTRSECIIESGIFSNDRIKKIIARHKINLVVMGASHDGFKNTFFGSRVSDLIDKVNCPILSLPHGYNNFNIKKIGFASELFDLPTRIKIILPFAGLFDANVDVFHVYPVYPQEVDVKKYNIEKELEKIKQKYKYENISLQFIKTAFDNEPVTGIRKYIETQHPDILVMFHKPRGLFDKFALDEGTTSSMIKKGQVPVLAFNKKSALKII
jgi:nucleotide-binding universal stress UspA family protein